MVNFVSDEIIFFRDLLYPSVSAYMIQPIYYEHKDIITVIQSTALIHRCCGNVKVELQNFAAFA